MQHYLIVGLYSYLLGTVHASYITGKLYKRIDIREYGTNNSGASNAFIIMGKRFGVLVAFLDGLKGLVAVLLTAHLFETNINLMCFSVLMAVVGHMYPFYMQFKGGKGLSTIIGATVGINLPLALVMFAALAFISYLSNYLSVGSIAVAFLAFLWIAVGYQLVPAALFYFIVFILMVYKHKINYYRIRNNEESKFRDAFKSKK